MEKTLAKNLEIHITTHCTLKCAMCGNGIKYVKDPEHYPLGFLQHEIDLMFKLVDYTDKLEVMGGETLLHPHLPEILEKILEYAPQIGVLRVPTNGTIMPSQKLIDVFLENRNSPCKMEFLVSDYGKPSKHLGQIVKMCEENGIPCRVDKYHGDDMYCGGWVNFGVDIAGKQAKSPEETKRLFDSCVCAAHGYAMFTKGKMYPCSASLLRTRSGVGEKIPDLIDLFDETTMEQRRVQFKKVFETPYYVCRYCDGMNKDSKRYPGGEQA